MAGVINEEGGEGTSENRRFLFHVFLKVCGMVYYIWCEKREDVSAAEN